MFFAEGKVFAPDAHPIPAPASTEEAAKGGCLARRSNEFQRALCLAMISGEAGS